MPRSSDVNRSAFISLMSLIIRSNCCFEPNSGVTRSCARWRIPWLDCNGAPSRVPTALAVPSDDDLGVRMPGVEMIGGGRAVSVDRGCRQGVRARWPLARDGRLAGGPYDLLPQRGSVPERDCRMFLILLAGELGFEPRLAESESAVLPLNYSPVGARHLTPELSSKHDRARQAPQPCGAGDGGKPS
jgi:hypothetical protein